MPMLGDLLAAARDGAGNFRLWLKVTPARTYVAGVAEKTTRLGRELRLMGAELGSRDALRPGDTTPEA